MARAIPACDSGRRSIRPWRPSDARKSGDIDCGEKSARDGAFAVPKCPSRVIAHPVANWNGNLRAAAGVFAAWQAIGHFQLLRYRNAVFA
jgi:hypothetical protein